MSRRRREKAILDIVSKQPVGTQSELVEELRHRGLEASQSTVSRDVKRLGLVKVPGGDGGYRYRPPEEPPTLGDAEERLRDAVDEFVIGMTRGTAIVALTTSPGGANALAAAMDRADLDGVEATLAGDDTVFVLVRDRDAAAEIRSRLPGWA